jgi:hypothetical protein
MQLVSRDAWGARAPRNRTSLHRSEQRGTGVHYSGSAAESTADHGLCDNVVRSIQRFHMDSRGWSDIAYSYLVCIHGAVFEGRGRGVRTAANGTNAGNDGYHAVCFLGGDAIGRDDVSDAGRAAIADAVHHCNAWAGVDEVRPHSFFKATGCPGAELRAWIAAGMPVAEPSPPVEDDMTPEQAQQLNDVTASVNRIEAALFQGHAINKDHPIDNLFDAAGKTHQALIVPGTTSAEDAFNMLFGRVRNIEDKVLSTMGEVEQISTKVDTIAAALPDLAEPPPAP